MQKVDELKEQLKEAILDSDEYKEYLSLKNEVDREPELRRMVDEFRKQNFELQIAENAGDIILASQDLNARFKDLRSRECVNRYLTAELSLCRMIHSICTSLVEDIDLNLDFLR